MLEGLILRPPEGGVKLLNFEMDNERLINIISVDFEQEGIEFPFALRIFHFKM